MPTYLKQTAGAFVKYEAPMGYSRDEVTVVAGQNLTAGTVVGRIAASGKIKAWDPAAADGSETAIGVLVAAVDATAGDAPGVIVSRHAIVVDADSLVWAGSPTQGEKDAAVASLAAAGILARKTA